MPVVNPVPFSSRVPWIETWCGLLLHLAVGMQLTLVMRTVWICGLEACFVAALCGLAFCAGLEGAALPPELVAFAEEREPAKQHSSADATVASTNMDRWGALFAKKIPSRR
jgi:hypothetical protein